MRVLPVLLLCVGCASGTPGSSSSSSSSSTSTGGPADAAMPELPCEALPNGVTEGSASTDGGPRGVPTRRLVLMGGGTEVDEASRTFVESAGGQDVLVLRATGSVESYTAYFSSELAPDPVPATVTTLRLDEPSVSAHPAVLCRIHQAESLWFAGGDQWDYAGLWSPALHDEVAASRATLGGTSAGAMVLSQFIFTAQHGSITSGEALADPLPVGADIARSPMADPALTGMLVDTHFTERAREGRLLVFAAHALQQGAPGITALGLDEDTALVVTGDTFVVQGAGSVWVYEVTGPVEELAAGAPLSLGGITRRAFAGGATGLWPIRAQGGTALQVDRGTVVAP